MPPNTDNFSEKPDPTPDWALPGEPPPPFSGPAGPPPPPGPAGPPPLPGAPGPGLGDPLRRDGLAVVALVTGLCGLALLGIGFGIAALVRIGRRGGRGRGLAVGGIVASVAWTAVVIVVLAMAVGSLFNAERDEAGHIRESGKVFVATLRVGDCFTGFNKRTSDRLVTALPCDRPHDGEIVAKTRLADGPYPGERQATGLASEACQKKITRLAKSRYVQDLEIYAIHPDGTAWRRGERGVTCALRYTGAGSLTTPLAATVVKNAKTLGEYAVGDCFGKWQDELPLQRTVSCKGPHWSEVYWVQALPAGSFPGDRVVTDRAGRLCERRAARTFTGSRRPQRIGWVHPREDDWRAGVRQVACLAENARAPTRGSILPR